MASVRHSIGLAIYDRDPGDRVFSFRVSPSDIGEGAGWGRAGLAPEVAHWPNPPADPTRVYTVLVEGFGDRRKARRSDDDSLAEDFVLAGLRTLVEVHIERYGQCQVWVSPGAAPFLTRWWEAGCPPPADLLDMAAAAELAELEGTADFPHGAPSVSFPVAEELGTDQLAAEAAQRAEEYLAEAQRRGREVSSDELDALARDHIRERVAEAKRPMPKAGPARSTRRCR